MVTYRHTTVLDDYRYYYDPYIRSWTIQNMNDDFAPCQYCYNKEQLKEWHPEFKFVKEIEPETYL